MLDIIAIKSNKGYFISKASKDGVRHSWDEYDLSRYLFNGVKPESSFHKNWHFIPEVPAKVSHIESQPNINHRFVLTDDSLKSDKIPLELKRDDVVIKTDCEGNTIWKPEYAMYRSLYVEVSDEQPPKEVPDEFTFTVLFEIGNVVPPPDFKYPIEPRWVDHKSVPDSIGSSSIVHQELDQIIFPSLFKHMTPCKLSVTDTYNVVRQYIKDNINPRVAKITSDYDFIFEVSKRIPITKPYTTKHSYKPHGRGKTKIEYVTTSEKTTPIFAIAPKPYSDRNAIILPCFEGKNEDELKENIDTYLKNLIAFINEPVKECPTCKGTGVLFNESMSQS